MHLILDRETPLTEGQLATVRYLVRVRSAFLKEVDGAGNTCFHTAAQHGHTAALEMMLGHIKPKHQRVLALRNQAGRIFEDEARRLADRSCANFIQGFASERISAEYLAMKTRPHTLLERIERVVLHSAFCARQYPDTIRQITARGQANT